jgi:hypothetical protein
LLPVGTIQLSTLLDRGYTSVPVLAIPRSLAARLDRLRVGRPLAVAVFLAGQWPTILNELVNVIWPGLAVATVTSRAWLVVCGALGSLMMLSAASGWRRLRAAGDAVQELVGDSADLERWLRRLLSPARQLAFAVPVGALTVLMLYAIHTALPPDVPVRPASYLMAGWVGFLGANVIYWLCAMGDLPRRVRRGHPVTLLKHDPAMTPGLIAMCDGYIFVAATMSAGVLATELTAIMLPNRHNSALLQGLVLYFPILAGIIALWAAIQPFLPIYLMARDVKRQTLLELSAEVGTGPVAHNRMLELYFHIRSASLLPINTATIVQYGAAIVGVVGGFAIPKIIA